MSQAVLGWGRKNSEGSLKRNEARQARPVCAHAVPPRRSTEGLFILWLLCIVSAKFWNETVVFWQTWSKNIWNKPDGASTKSSLMPQPHIKLMSDCENKPLFSSSKSLWAAVCQILCGTYLMWASLCSLYFFTICNSGYLVGGLHHGRAPHWKATLPRNRPYPSTATASCVLHKCSVQSVLGTDEAHRCTQVLCIYAVLAVNCSTRVNSVIDDCGSPFTCWLSRRLELLVFANSRLKLLWYYTVTMQHSARQRTQLTCEQITLHLLIGINQQCPDRSDVI